MEYYVGQKVVMVNNSPDTKKRYLYGHTCIIVKIINKKRYDSSSKRSYSRFYRLAWTRKDNPGRKAKVHISRFYCNEDDFIAYAYPSRISGELPDI